MTNWDVAEDALQTSLNSQGSAVAEHEKWLESLEAKLLQLKAAWQGFSQAFMSSDLLKGGLDFLINFLEIITKLIDELGVIPTLAGGFAAFKILKTGIGVGGISKLADILPLISLSFPKAAKGAGNFTAALKGTSGAAQGAGGALGKMVSLLTNPYIAAAAIAITAVTTAIMYQKKKAEELSQEVDNLIDKYKEQHSALMENKADYDTSNEDSMISKYEKLSKGVDGLGRNLSLTTDEYSEYQSIVNQIAEQVPSLVSGYDEQGNAILSCKGNVEQLTEAYQKLIHAQNQEILTNSGDIEKDFANELEKQSGEHWWSNGHGVLKPLLGSFADYELKNDTVKDLQDWLSATNKSEKEKAISNLKADAFSVEEIRDALNDAGFEVGAFDNVWKELEKAYEKDPQKIKGIIDNYSAQFDELVNQQKTIAEAKLSEAFDIDGAISGLNYSGISENLQAIAYSVVSSFDYDFLSQLSEQGQTVEGFVTDMLNQFNAMSKADSVKIDAAFDLQTKFNNGEVSYGQYVKGLQEVGNVIDTLNLDDKIKSDIKLNLGLNEEGIVEEYKTLINRLTETSKENVASGNVIGLSKEAAKEFLDGLSAEEYSVAMDVITDPDFIIDKDATDAEIRAAIQSAIDLEMALQGITEVDIKVETAGIEALNTALEESRTAAGLTADSITALKGRYEDLEGYNAAVLFEKTANGIHLNNEELRKLEAQYANTQKLNIDSSLNTLAVKYNELSEEMANCTDEQKKESLQSEVDIYANRIEELSTLASQYEGLTSAFNQWQSAQEGAEEGDNYDSLYDSLESIKELYEGGLVGTDKFRTAVQLMSNEDLSTASVDELVAAYKKGFPKIQRYFTEGSEGCQRFLKDVSNLNSEWAHMNEDGSWEIDFGTGNDQEVADALGINVESVQQILRKLKDYGFEVEIDSEYTSLNGLQTKIEETETKLKELNEKPVDINVDIEADAKNIKTIETEIENAKSKIEEINNSSVKPEVKTAQLEDAKAKLEALIDKKIEASQPTFMSLNTSQVSASLVDVLGKVQEYQTALNELNKLSELKEAGITIDDSQITLAQQKVDDCAQAIQGLDNDVKVSIGLEQDGSIDSIKQAFEEGKVNIDADTSPAITKVEQLAEDVEKIEDKDITINVKVKGLDDVKKLNKNIDLATKIDGDVDNLSEYVKSAKTLSELGNNVVSYVTANIDGNIKDIGEGELENLKTFAGSAKQLGQLKEVGSFTTNIDADVNADVRGNVTKKTEEEIDNLSVFADEVKSLYGVKGVSITASADVRGNVIKKEEKALDNLSMFADEVRSLSGVEGVSITVSADIKGNVIKKEEKALDNLSMFADEVKSLEGVEGVSITASADIKGNVIKKEDSALDNLSLFADQVESLKDIEGKSVTAYANIDGNVIKKEDSQLDNIGLFADQVESLADVEGKSVTASAEIKGNVTDKDDSELNNIGLFAEQVDALKDVEGKSVTAFAKIDGNVVKKSKEDLNNIGVFAEEVVKLADVEGKAVIASADIDGNVTKKDKSALENIGVFATQVDALKDVEGKAVSASADIDGNVTRKDKESIENIGIFAEQVDKLKDVKGVAVTASADIDGNVTRKDGESLKNLGIFAEEVEKLKDVEGVAVTASADIDGNVIKKSKKDLENIGVFADQLDELKGVKGVAVTASADIDGNVIRKDSSALKNLGVFAEQLEELKDAKGTAVTASADIDGNVIRKDKKDLENIGVFAEQVGKLKGVEGKSVTASVDVKGNAVGRNGSDKLDNLKSFVKNAGKLSDIGSPESVATAKIEGNVTEDGNKKLKKFSDVAAVLKSVGSVVVEVAASIATKAIEDAIALLTKVRDSGLFKNYSANVKVDTSVDSTAVDNYQPPKKNSTVSYDIDANSPVFTWEAPEKTGKIEYSPIVKALTDSQKNKTGTITYKAKISGFPVVNGTANINGTAFASGTTGMAFKQGDWKTKKDVTALTGELGQELVVPPNGNRWYTVGDNGAEFAHIPRGSIVFNHKQTEELFKNGRVTSGGGRGTALASGTAFSNAVGGFYNDGKKVTVEADTVNVTTKSSNSSSSSKSSGSSKSSKSSSSSSSKKSSSKSSSDEADEFEETIDFIEIKISRIERAIDQLDLKANSIYKNWTTRNNALIDEIEKVQDEITIQQKAYDKYMSTASSVGLSSSWAEKVRNGEINIRTITDESLAEKIKEYQEWYLNNAHMFSNKYVNLV